MAGEGGWDEAGAAGFGERKLKNTLPLYGNKESMNLNSMILTNIVGSPYFKEELINYKTFHEVVDEIYYKVDHLEPWEKNSRKLAGQVGMCAGVRGVAAGGIVSTAFCLLFKLFTLKLTRKQVTAMLNHRDSPYIRGIGFMYVRYCQPPPDFWDWFSPYFEDEEEIDLKAGGGYSVCIGEMCRMMISKLDWFGTLFPRLPVNVQKDIDAKMREFKMAARLAESAKQQCNGEVEGGESAGRVDEERRGSQRASPRGRSRSRERRRSRSRSRDARRRSRSRERRKSRSRSRDKRRSRSRSRDRRRSRERRRSLSRDRSRRGRRSRSRERRSRSGGRRRSPPSRDRHGYSQNRRSHSRERRR